MPWGSVRRQGKELSLLPWEIRDLKHWKGEKASPSPGFVLTNSCRFSLSH